MKRGPVFFGYRDDRRDSFDCVRSFSEMNERRPTGAVLIQGCALCDMRDARQTHTGNTWHLTLEYPRGAAYNALIRTNRRDSKFNDAGSQNSVMHCCPLVR